jgi:hypothetical protein
MAAFLQDQERPLLCIATDQVEDYIDLLSQNGLRQWMLPFHARVSAPSEIFLLGSIVNVPRCCFKSALTGGWPEFFGSPKIWGEASAC